MVLQNKKVTKMKSALKETLFRSILGNTTMTATMTGSPKHFNVKGNIFLGTVNSHLFYHSAITWTCSVKVASIEDTHIIREKRWYS